MTKYSTGVETEHRECTNHVAFSQVHTNPKDEDTWCATTNSNVSPNTVDVPDTLHRNFRQGAAIKHMSCSLAAFF